MPNDADSDLAGIPTDHLREYAAAFRELAYAWKAEAGESTSGAATEQRRDAARALYAAFEIDEALKARAGK